MFSSLYRTPTRPRLTLPGGSGGMAGESPHPGDGASRKRVLSTRPLGDVLAPRCAHRAHPTLVVVVPRDRPNPEFSGSSGGTGHVVRCHRRHTSPPSRPLYRIVVVVVLGIVGRGRRRSSSAGSQDIRPADNDRPQNRTNEDEDRYSTSSPLRSKPELYRRRPRPDPPLCFVLFLASPAFCRRGPLSVMPM